MDRRSALPLFPGTETTSTSADEMLIVEENEDPRALRLLTWNIRYDWMNSRGLHAQKVSSHPEEGLIPGNSMAVSTQGTMRGTCPSRSNTWNNCVTRSFTWTIDGHSIHAK
jgi:hypothetical protein